jgi:ribosomal protein S18 acetylase RimI-like enzyme
MVSIQDLTVSDLNEAISLWRTIPELNFSVEFDTEKRLLRFLLKNQNFSTIAKLENQIVGALLCGNDGRRGFFYHIGVSPDFRNQKIATRMVKYSFKKLRHDDIDTCFLFTSQFYSEAQAFWKSMGFEYASHVMYQSRAI